MITGKAFNSRWVLERALRDHALRIDQTRVKAVSERLQQALPQIQQTEELDLLRGLEGEAAVQYFSVFDELILSQKAYFIFDGRNRRPPQDNVNAMLSFAYSLLANDCAAALKTNGLNAYVGFLHRDRPGRKSLALDLEEELRAPFADRLVLTLINNRTIHDKHFERSGKRGSTAQRHRTQALPEALAGKEKGRNPPPLPERENGLGGWFPMFSHYSLRDTSAVIWMPIRRFCGNSESNLREEEQC